MGRREDEGESNRRHARHRMSPSPAHGESNEEVIRNKLRESGWKKRRTESDSTTDVETLKDKEAVKEMTEKRTLRGVDERRSSRKSRSSRRTSRSPRRRDREHRSSRRKSSGSRRRSPSRSRSAASRSRSRSRSYSQSTGRRRHHHSLSLRKRRSSRSVSRERDGNKLRRSRSTSASKRKSSTTVKSEEERKKRKMKKEEEEEEEEEDVEMKDEEDEEKRKRNGEKENGKKKEDEEEEEKEKDERYRPSVSRKNSRRSRSRSPQSPSRSSRRRRHRRDSSYSRSRSPPRSRRVRRGGSRSRSAPRDRHSRGRNHDRRSRRRGRSYSRSLSPSYNRGHRRLERSSSRDPPRHDANSSPEAHQHPPVAPDTAPAGVGIAPHAPSTGVNPTITQLMAQYPTMSLQDIIAKMQASNVTMAAAVAQKPARELYVGNLPPNVTGPQLQEFLSTIIQQVGLTTQPGNPIINTWISTDGHFAFCEMRSVEECNLALLLNQLSLLGQPLKFGRPRSFMGPPQPMPQISARTQTALTNLGCTPNPAWFAQPPIPSITEATTELPTLSGSAIMALVPDIKPAVTTATTAVSAGSHHLIMSNIPVVLAEDQVKELVEPFGALKSFILIKDAVTGASMGSALFEYEDETVAAQALEGLNGLSIGGILLSVQRQPLSSEAALGVLPGTVPNPEDQPSAVLKMANMVSVDELKDDEEYADLAEDVEEECKRFGNVTRLEIPRPKDGEEVPGLGCIYVCFGKEEDAASALKALNGRKFGGNIVKVTYFPVDKFEKLEFV